MIIPNLRYLKYIAAVLTFRSILNHPKHWNDSMPLTHDKAIDVSRQSTATMIANAIPLIPENIRPTMPEGYDMVRLVDLASELVETLVIMSITKQLEGKDYTLKGEETLRNGGKVLGDAQPILDAIIEKVYIENPFTDVTINKPLLVHSHETTKSRINFN